MNLDKYELFWLAHDMAEALTEGAEALAAAVAEAKAGLDEADSE